MQQQDCHKLKIIQVVAMLPHNLLMDTFFVSECVCVFVLACDCDCWRISPLSKGSYERRRDADKDEAKEKERERALDDAGEKKKNNNRQ